MAMPSSKGQPRRCHGQLPGHRRETPSRKHQLTPTQLKAGAEQTPNCHKSTLSSVLLQSSKAYSLLHVTKATGVQGQPWPGIPMQKPTIPKPCRVSQEIGFYSSSATQGKTLTNLRGFKCFPGLKKSALTSKFCGMASQTPFQSTKQMERGFYWHLFFFCTASLEVVNLLVPISILHCTPVIGEIAVQVQLTMCHCSQKDQGQEENTRLPDERLFVAHGRGRITSA